MLEAMSRMALRWDRRLAAGASILAASTAMLAFGLFSIVAALRSGGAELPHQGNIQDILADTASGASRQAGSGAPGAPVIAPVRLHIPRLYIDAPVVIMGVDENRIPQVPDRPDQIAWYDFSAPPGQGSNAVFSGHVDWQTRQGDPIPGVFYRLREMEIGDTIDLTLEDGTRLEYKVTGNVATPYDDPNVVKAMQPTSRDVITLITCGGTWLRDPGERFGGNYSHRIIVRAERVDARAPGSGGQGS
jgi:LPXTG-site transpeptidase (sortase) family protein